MKNLKLFLIVFTLVTSSLSSYAQKALSNSTKFLQEAATMGMNAEALGNLGQKQLENPETKAYALEVLNIQVAANAQLKTLAKKKKVKLPEPMSIPVNSMQTRIDTSDFDKSFLEMIIEDQKKAITLYESAAKYADRDVKSYASKYLIIYKRNVETAIKLSKEEIAKE